MYCSNCGQTQCYCYCWGCGSPWMNCQGGCGRPPMFIQRKDRSNDPPVIIREVNNAIDYAIYAVVMCLVPILGFMGIKPRSTPTRRCPYRLALGCSSLDRWRL